MDFIAELISEVFCGILEDVFESEKVKVRVKAVLYGLMTGALTALIVLSGISCFRDGRTSDGIILLSIAAAMAAAFSAGGVLIYRRWKSK